MPTWFPPVLAVAAGLIMALVAAAPVPPAAAFVGGVIGVLGAAALAGRLRGDGASVPAGAARPEAAALPGAYGRQLVEKLPTPLLIIARTGRIAYANPAAQAALPRVEAGVHYASVIRAPAFVEAVGATLADGDERRFEFTAHQQGGELIFEARVGRLPSGGDFGPEAQAIVQIEDRTQARRAEQLRSDFIANASHELRTPLASIIGYIETLQHHARDDAAARARFLEIMAREAGRMQRLVEDLMSLSRIEMNEHLRPVEEWSLYDIAADSAAALQPLARQEGIALEIALPPGGGHVLGDRDQLCQVFSNLIDNAMKYGGPGGTVRIAAAEPGRAHRNRHGVSVVDGGPGIDRQHVHRLTERFYRVNVGQSRARGGTGLGLAIVKHILNRHEGRLEIASTPGEGSTFTVWLPKSGAAEPRVEAPEPEPEPRSASGG